MEEVYTGKKRRRSGLWVGKIDISHQLVYAPQSVEFGVKWSDQRFLLPSSLHPLFFFALPLSPEGGSRGRKIQQGRDQPGNQYSLLHDRPRTSTSSMTKAQNQLARGGGGTNEKKTSSEDEKGRLPYPLDSIWYIGSFIMRRFRHQLWPLLEGGRNFFEMRGG